MKKLLTLLALLCSFCIVKAEPVELKQALTVAKNYFAKVHQINIPESDLIEVPTNFNTFYLFQTTDGGKFVIVASDNLVRPILGYSTTNGINSKGPLPENMVSLLTEYEAQIHYAIREQLSPLSEVPEMWNALLYDGDYVTTETLSTPSVAPMVTTYWNQSPRYNDLCPYDNTLNARSVTGCVATAMSQLMRYWSYPAHGVGSHSYTHSTYGTLSANFGATTYDWGNMPSSLSSSSTTSQVTAVATLCYHAGVAINMDYSPEGSGATTIGSGNTAENALKTYFDYNPSLQGKYKSSVANDSVWISLCVADLVLGRPLIYRGSGSSGGHCWVCDGINSMGQLHFNWGWGGSGDGYFPVTSLISSGMDFSSSQGAIFGIYPNNTSGASVRNIALQDASATTATITWNDPNVPYATRYRIRYAPSETFNENVASSYIKDSCTVRQRTLSGLQNSTLYTIQICAVSSTWTSDWATYQFRTECPSVSAPYDYGFEDVTSASSNGEINPCWRKFTNSSTPYPYPSTILSSGSYGLYFSVSSSNYAYTVLPTFDDTLNTLQVSVSIRRNSVSTPARLRIGIMTDPYDPYSFQELGRIEPSSTSWTNATAPLTAYRGQGRYIALMAGLDGMSSNSFYIDDVIVDAAPSCVSPANITLKRASANELTITWRNRNRNNPLKYQVEYGENSANASTTKVFTTDTFLTITNLMSSTDYKARVRAICAPGDSAEWTPHLTVSTRCDAIGIPFSENFESYSGTGYNSTGSLPQCWMGFSNGENTAFVPHIVSGSGIYAYYHGSKGLVMTSGSSSYGNNHIVTLPEFSSPVRNLLVSFWMCTESSTAGTLQVGYLTSDDTSSFVAIKTIPASSATVHSGNGNQTTAGISDTVDFSSASPDARFVAFRWVYNSSYYTCCLDDISVFSNGCDAITVTPEQPYIEDFETNSNCWASVQNSGTTPWLPGSGSHYSGDSPFHGSSNMFLYVQSYGGNIADLVSPRLDLSAGNTGYLKFAHMQRAWTPDQDTLCVLYRPNASSDWIRLASYTNNISNWVVDSLPLPEVSEWVEIIFRGNALYGYGIAIDLVEIGVINTAPALHNLEALSMNPTMGSVSGSGTYSHGDTAVITANANSGFQFVAWSDWTTENPYAITVTQDTVIRAFFAESTHDTTYIHDTTTVNQYIHDTTYITQWQYDTIILNHLYDTIVINHHDTTFVNNYIEVPVHDTTYVVEWLHDTTIVNNFIHDTTLVNHFIHDTTIVNNFIHDTTFITQWQYDTTFINTYIHDTTFVDVLLYDTITLRDTILVPEQLTLFNLVVSSAEPSRGLASGNGRFPENTQVEIAAIPIAGNRFLNWNDGNTQNPRIVNLSGNQSYTAIFGALEGVETVEGIPFTILASNMQIMVKDAPGKRIRIFDSVGRLLSTTTSPEDMRIFNMPVSGVYLVQVGESPAQKVVVIE